MSSTISRCFLQFLFLLLSSMIYKTASAAPILSYPYCPNTSFAGESSFQSNRDHLLSSLASNATQPNSFYNTTVGSTSSGSAVYGLFLCRGDDSRETCQTCVETAVNFAGRNCSRADLAVIWYNVCMIGYSNEPFSDWLDGAVDPVTSGNGYNATENITEFIQIMDDMLQEIASKAASGGSSKKFATQKTNFSSPQMVIYGLGQCIPDLSASDCNGCLQKCIGLLHSCCSGQLGARVLVPSCNLRYEIYPFYQMIATTAPAPASPPAIAPAGTTGDKKSSSAKLIIAIVVPTTAALVLLIAVRICHLTGKTKNVNANVSEGLKTVESLQYDFRTLQAATNIFSSDNKIGEGGFGAVYKGTLSNGQEIVVKRLSVNSSQGAEQFKNEVELVAKLQYRNLVSLLGFCLVEGEKLLIYEFVPNKSLDYFLFDLGKQVQLDWSSYRIIKGVARGILYLHEDSQLRVVHCGLKASNVLLGADMNPKFYFGLARIFGVD